MTPSNKIRYRPEVDGLRAIAVLVVLLFHGKLGASGGYVGVDVFFVISGFLITSLIWSDLESGQFTFSGFWERRARRIVPALVVVTLVTLIGGWFFLLPAEYRGLGRATASQAVFAANIHYWLDSGYFADAAEEMPLLHTWSLALEEQFYLVVPVLFFALYRSTRLRSKKSVLALLVSGFVVSLALSIYGVSRHPSAAFYLLPSRAWELILGSILVFVHPSRALPTRGRTRGVVSAAGLAMILVPAFLYTVRTPFPGVAALVPCLGTAALIWANGRSEGEAPTAVGALLSRRPVVFVGLISYSLYLWHWPFVALGNYLSLTPMSLALRVAVVTCSVPLAIASWRWVETPFRKRQLAPTKRSMFVVSGCALVVTLLGGIAVWSTQGFPERFPLNIQRVAGEKAELASQKDLSIKQARAGQLTPIGSKDPGKLPRVVVWGDSHAMAALPALDALLEERGVAGRAALHAATAPVLDWSKNTAHGLGKASVEYNDAIFSFIRDQHISDVILVAYWSSYGGGDSWLDAAILSTVKRLAAAGCRPWVLLDTPIPGFNVPKALSLYSSEFIATLCPKASDELARHDAAFVHEIETRGGKGLDPKPRFLDPTSTHYVVSMNDAVLYCDAHHLSKQGAERVLLPFLRESWRIE